MEQVSELKLIHQMSNPTSRWFGISDMLLVMAHLGADKEGMEWRSLGFTALSFCLGTLSLLKHSFLHRGGTKFCCITYVTVWNLYKQWCEEDM